MQNLGWNSQKPLNLVEYGNIKRCGHVPFELPSSKTPGSESNLAGAVPVGSDGRSETFVSYNRFVYPTKVRDGLVVEVPQFGNIQENSHYH